MKGKGKGSGRAMSMPAGIGMGVGISYGIMLLSAAVLAWLILTQRVGEEVIGWGSMLILAISAALGSLTAWTRIRHRRLFVTAVTAAGYYAVLLVTALAFGGGFSGMGATAGMVVLGGGIAQIPALFGGGSGVRRHKMKAFR